MIPIADFGDDSVQAVINQYQGSLEQVGVDKEVVLSEWAHLHALVYKK